MKLVYGVSGEGLGHVFEALEIDAALRRDGHTVKMLTYGDRACQALRALNPTRIEGIVLQFDRKGLSLSATVRHNLHCVWFYARNWARLKRELAAFRPDAFITAYEPFSTLASHVLRRPLISMDNQNELLHIAKPRGADRFSFRLAQVATRICTYGAADYIVKSFQRPAEANSHVHFVSPLVQREIRSLQPELGRHVLVT